MQPVCPYQVNREAIYSPKELLLLEQGASSCQGVGGVTDQGGVQETCKCGTERCGLVGKVGMG